MKKLSLKKIRPAKKGFGLIEVGLVLVVIAILAAAAYPRFRDKQDVSKAVQDAEASLELGATVESILDGGDFGSKSDFVDSILSLKPKQIKVRGTQMLNGFDGVIHFVPAADTSPNFLIANDNIPSGKACVKFVKKLENGMFYAYNVVDQPSGSTAPTYSTTDAKRYDVAKNSDYTKICNQSGASDRKKRIFVWYNPAERI
ncbi:prepilin-type N-terminal cleavage/methylation domain-containing protein [Photobacterium leiognathi]|uniref:prepilin-type N-terminal cleavage/methylation domain-containing protein n=1 Tax=Photobacterium leiognathi TaxID=553611 RepID=UPI002980CA7E|nr:prepilin-type N-terminal cleavage/methylation domain-containing protein [Photobacterium leiognathi]